MYIVYQGSPTKRNYISSIKFYFKALRFQVDVLPS